MSKYVTFSFDDGTEQDKDLCAMLREYGYKCTFNLNSGIQSASYCWEKEGKKVRRLNVDEAIEAYRGHEIAAHTLTHPRLETLDDETVRNEVFYDKRIWKTGSVRKWSGWLIPAVHMIGASCPSSAAAGSAMRAQRATASALTFPSRSWIIGRPAIMPAPRSLI